MYGLLWCLDKKVDTETQVAAAAERFEKRTGVKATTVQIPGHTGNGQELAGLAVIGGPGSGQMVLVGVEDPYAASEDGLPN
jgi:hypothetical protein